jgi:hypothetical protein
MRSWQSKQPVGRAQARKDADFPASRRTSSVVCPSYSLSASSRWRGRPQSGDQRQDVREHLSRYRDLGQPEGDVAAMADDLGADLDQLLAQAGQPATAPPPSASPAFA